MNTHRRTAMLVGAGFLVATISFIISNALVTPLLDSPGYLAKIGGSPTTVGLAALLAMVDGLAVVAVAALLFPILRSHDQPIAAGYLGIRIAELAAVTVFALSPLLLLTLSTGSTPGTAAIGDVLLGLRSWSLLFVYVLSGIAGFMLCVVLFRSRLVPRPLTVLGLVGYAVFVTAAALGVVGYLDIKTGSGMLALVPGGLFEILLPIVLFIKGFSSSASPANRDFELLSAPTPAR